MNRPTPITQARPVPKPNPAREEWQKHLQRKELEERLELHRRLAFGESR